MSKNRTSIPHLPEELLEKIFNDFEERDLLNCQRVCRAWYKPIHLRLLQHISLNNILLANHFINAIDSNPDPAYLNAVKKIRIANIHGRMFKHSVIPAFQSFIYNKETLHKLFFRFPNLGHIEVCQNLEFLMIFTDELCETLLKCCPKLETFIINPCGSEEENPAIWSMRRLMTRVEPPYTWPSGIKNKVEYITSFPRVQQLKWSSVNFEELLQILETSPGLTELEIPMSILPTSVDKFMKVDPFPTTRTQLGQDLLLKRLSEITVLKGSSFSGPKNSIDFILKFLTGLKTIYMFGAIEYSNELGFIEYWRKVAELGDTVDEVDVSYPLTEDEFFENYRHIENAVYREPPTCEDSITGRLEIAVTYGLHYHKINVDTSFRRKLSKCLIKIHMPCPKCWRIRCKEFLKQRESGRKIEEFALSFNVTRFRRCDLDISVYAYYEFLDAMPSLKRVLFDVPDSFKEEYKYSKSTHSNVQELTLRGRIDISLDELIHGLYERLPKLKHLILICYCGNWSSRTYKLDLNSFNLEALSIDVGPIELRMPHLSDYDFFIVNLRKGKRLYVYKVSISLSTCRRISQDESIHGKDYVTIDISIADLKKLRFFIGYDKDDTYCSFDLLKRAKRRANITINCSHDQY